MNAIIDSLNLPCDIKYEIKNYCYDNLGYTYDELNEIKKSGLNKNGINYALK